MRRPPKRVLVASALVAGVLWGAAEEATRPPRLRPLPLALRGIRTDSAMRTALRSYVFVGLPARESVDRLEELGFRCERARNAGEPAPPPGAPDDTPLYCNYFYPGDLDDLRAWGVLLDTRGDTLRRYGVSGVTPGQLRAAYEATYGVPFGTPPARPARTDVR